MADKKYDSNYSIALDILKVMLEKKSIPLGNRTFDSNYSIALEILNVMSK